MLCSESGQGWITIVIVKKTLPRWKEDRVEYIIVNNVLNYAWANKSFANVNKTATWKKLRSYHLLKDDVKVQSQYWNKWESKTDSMSKSEESSWCQISWPKIPYYNQRAKTRLVAPVSLVKDETRAVFDYERDRLPTSSPRISTVLTSVIIREIQDKFFLIHTVAIAKFY